MTKRITTIGINATVSSSPWNARMDAEHKSETNSARYTSNQKDLAKTTQDLINCAYNYKAVYTNFRKKFISVKISEPRTYDRDSVLLLDNLFASRDYVKVLTPQGIIFRIPR